MWCSNGNCVAASHEKDCFCCQESDAAKAKFTDGYCCILENPDLETVVLHCGVLELAIFTILALKEFQDPYPWTVRYVMIVACSPVLVSFAIMEFPPLV